jgi:broad specificity phosphatase PhoE
MKLIVVRHGETEWNAEGREIGQLDSLLTPRGVDQAERLAQRLGRMPIAMIYSSDLGRAMKTAEILAAACGADVRPEPGVRERHMGVFQGLTGPEIRRQFPDERRRTTRIRTTPFLEARAGRNGRSEPFAR